MGPLLRGATTYKSYLAREVTETRYSYVMYLPPLVECACFAGQESALHESDNFLLSRPRPAFQYVCL